MSRGSTQFPRRVYPFSAEGIPDSCQVCFSDFSGWLWRPRGGVQVFSVRLRLFFKDRCTVFGVCMSHSCHPERREGSRAGTMLLNSHDTLRDPSALRFVGMT